MIADNREITDCLVYSEKSIRQALKGKIGFSARGKATKVIIDELKLADGESRIDVALVDTSIHGFELKSDADNLAKLPRQAYYYSKALDKVTLVVGYSHVYQVVSMVPSWWGISVVEKDTNGLPQFSIVRPGKLNPSIDAYSVSRLLYKWEVLDILKSLSLEKGTGNMSKDLLSRLLAETLELSDLRRFVRKSLIARIT